MRELFIAILSIIFFVIVIPILDSFSNLIQSIFNRKITQWQIELNKEQEQEEQTNHHVQAIGFTIPSDEQEEDE